MQFSARQTRGYGRKTVETRRLAAAENPPRRPRGGYEVHYGDTRTCSRLRGKAGESKRADRRRRRQYFDSRSAISRSAAHLETEETPLLLW
jgi:hypothetical protein